MEYDLESKILKRMYISFISLIVISLVAIFIVYKNSLVLETIVVTDKKEKWEKICDFENCLEQLEYQIHTSNEIFVTNESLYSSFKVFDEYEVFIQGWTLFSFRRKITDKL